MITGYEVQILNTKGIKIPVWIDKKEWDAQINFMNKRKANYPTPYKVKGCYIMRITDKRFPRKLKKKLLKEI